MKKFMFFVVVVLLFFVCCKKTPSEPDIYPVDCAVRVKNTGSSISDTLRYLGTYGNSSTSIDVDGILEPFDSLDYNIAVENKNDEVFASFQKNQAEGELTVKIGTIELDLYGNEVFKTKKEASTSAYYGSVYISWKPD